MLGNTVYNPPYYRREGLELQFVVAQWGLGYHLGNVIKYTCRAGHKGPEAQDLGKALRITEMCFGIFEAGIALAWPVLQLRDIEPALVIEAWGLSHNRATVVSHVHAYSHYNPGDQITRRALLTQIRFYLENELVLVGAQHAAPSNAAPDSTEATHA